MTVPQPFASFTLRRRACARGSVARRSHESKAPLLGSVCLALVLLFTMGLQSTRAGAAPLSAALLDALVAGQEARVAVGDSAAPAAEAIVYGAEDGAWSAFGSGMSGAGSPPPNVRAVAIYNGELVAGGEFTTAGGVSANRVAKWNGTEWTALGTGMNGEVFDLVVYNDELVAGGAFTTAGEVAANKIAKWDGAEWTPLGNGMNGNVLDLTVFNGELVAGGEFVTAGEASASRIAKWDGTDWASLGNGVNDRIWELAVHGDELVAGGTFTTAGGVGANRIAKWNGTEWTALGSGMNDTVYGLTVYNEELVATGWFTFAGGGSASRIAKWDGTEWTALGNGLGHAGYAIAVYQGELVVGGRFTTAGGVSANRIAKWDGADWTALGSGASDYVFVLFATGDDLVVGGRFANAGGVPGTSRVAKWSSATPAPTLAFEPLSLDFGDIPVGTISEPLTATLENTGDADATGLSFSTPGNGFAADTSNCGDTLGEGESCTVSVTFAPTVGGAAEATLEIDGDLGASAELGLVGEGIPDGGGGSCPGPSLTEVAKLVPSDGEAEDLFAWHVAISGNTALVGAPRADIDGNVDQGAAYVFVCNDETWAEHAKLVAPDGAAVDEFGWSVALSDDTALVGSRGRVAQGAAYVFTRDGDVWSEQAKLVASDTVAGDGFGGSVALSTEVAVVGANLAGDDGGDQGAAYVFTRDGDAWSERAKLVASDGGAFDEFGSAVAVADDTVVVGASRADVGENAEQGAAYVFHRDGDVWNEQIKLTASDGEAFDQAATIALSGETILLGGAHLVYVFVRDGEIWSEQATLTVSDDDDQSFVGRAVAISGDTAIVGIEFGGNGFTGVAYVFIRNGEGWSEHARLTASDGATSARFGENVALTGQTALVGARGTSGHAAYVFDIDDSGGGAPSFEIDPESLDFSDVPVGTTSEPLTATLENTGDADATGVSFSTPGNGFTADTSGCGDTLGQGESCTVSVTFTPTVTGAAEATLEIDGDLGASAELGLAGNGVISMDPPRIDVDPPSLSFTLGQGGMASDSLTISNLGDETLEWDVTEDGGTASTSMTHSAAVDLSDENPYGTVVCSDGPETFEHQFLRTFALSDFGITGAFNFSDVTFGVQTLTTPVSITVNLYTLAGELLYENLSLIGTATEDLEPQDLTLVTIPVSGAAPAGSTLVVEIVAPDLTGLGGFVPGRNDLGESAPSYIASTPCGIPEPLSYPDAGIFTTHLVLAVAGTTSVDCALPAWISTDSLSGTVPGGSSQGVEVTADATGLEPAAYAANLCFGSNDPDQPLTAAPLSLTVTEPAPELVFDPASLDFGDVPAGSTGGPLTATLQNGGNADATGLSFGAPGSGFEVDAGDCGDTLPGGGTCEVSVTFTPASSGPFDATLQVDSDEGAMAALGLIGEGTPGGGGNCPGPPLSQAAKLVASDGAMNDRFGFSVSVSGDTAVVGAFTASVAGDSNQGAAYVFACTDGVWSEQAKLVASDGAAEDRFGFSVAVSGDTALVGAHQSTVDGGPGAAYVFVRDGSVWTEQAKLTASDGVDGDQFGGTIALSSDTALIGAREADVGGTSRQGAAYVFVRDGEVWSEQAKLTASDGVANDTFGGGLAVSGDTALIGSWVKSSFRGAVYAFTRTDGVWSEQAKITASDGATNANFGFAIALSGDTALIGARQANVGGNNLQGAAYVFVRDGGVWSEDAKLVASDGAFADFFGLSVAVSGDTALIGAPDADPGGSASQGAAYVFARSGGVWSEEAKLTASDGAAEDRFGTSVALAGNAGLVGAWTADIGGNETQGAAYVFALDDGSGGSSSLEFDPESLDFGEVSVGTTSEPMTVALENTGDADVTGLSFGTPGNGFTADTGDCGDVLPQGESCTVSVTFSPSETGTAEATLEVSSDQGASASMELTGEGVPAGGGGLIRITEWMYQGAGGEFVELTNVGDEPVSLADWSYDDESRNPGVFDLSGFGEVQPGESVVFTEGNPGSFRDAWNLCAAIQVLGPYTNNIGRNDEINIYDAADELVDRLTYGDEDFPGSIRTRTRSGWVSAAGLGANDVFEWTLSSVGDAEGSHTSTGGDTGSPGKSTRATVPYEPCEAGGPVVSIDQAVVVGSIADPTNPTALLTLDHPMFDPEDLVVTVESTQESVLPADNVTVSGTGAERVVSFEPVGRGTSSVTFTATDPDEGEATVTIAYAASNQAPDPSGRYHHHISDASSALDVGDGYMLLVNDETNTIFLHHQTTSGLPVKTWTFTPGELGTSSEIDFESVARRDDLLVVSGSHGNNRSGNARPERRTFVGATITGSGADTELAFLGRYNGLWDDLRTWDETNGHGLGPDALGFVAGTQPGVEPNPPDGFNIEAMELAPDAATLYLGFRAPTLEIEGTYRALIVPVLNVDEIVDGAPATGPAVFGDPIFLDLDGRSIRELRRNDDFEYLLPAGPPQQNGTWALYTWDGDPDHAPQFNRPLPPEDPLTGGVWESIVSVPPGLEGGALVRMVTDSGDTNFYGTGQTKDLPQPFQKSYSQLFALEGTVLEPVLAFSPESFGFEVETGAGDTATLDIANLGTADLEWSIDEVSSTVEVGDGGGCDNPTDVPWLRATPDAGTTPPEGNTAVEVAVDATDLAPGGYEADLCIGSNDPDRPLVTVPLSLNVTPAPVPVLLFDPPNLDFGTVDVGSTGGPLIVTLRNTGALDATGLIFDLADPLFEADAVACGAALPVGGSCEIAVVFTPDEAGPATASLEVGSAEAVSASLPLSGSGVGDLAFVPVALEVDVTGFVSDGNGVFEPNELVEVEPSWRNDGSVGASLTGTAADFEGPDGAAHTISSDDADYGFVEPGATAGCRDAGLCYRLGVNDPPVRPATHWMATFDERLFDDTTQTWELHIGDSFTDVPRESPFYGSIETLLRHGVTGGCADTEYCPAGTNSRAQMAVFLLKAAEGGDYESPACVEGEERFADVPFDGTFCSWIEDLAGRGVTSGCGGDDYCPSDSVTRGQMAVFLLKAAEGGGYTPPGCTGEFSDVPCPSTFADWIEELAARGITGGCSADPPAYCPADPVTRAQMATFVTKAFGLTLYGL